jgi:hypothetical protein
LFPRLAITICLLLLLSGACNKTDALSKYEGSFAIKVATLHPAASFIIVDADSTSVDLINVNNISLVWKFKRVGDYFTITASDNPKHSLHVNDFGGLEVAKLPSVADNRYYFSIHAAKNNLVMIQSVFSGKYLYVAYCEKNGVTWSYDVNFVADITTCNANNTTADTCYCLPSFQLLKE